MNLLPLYKLPLNTSARIHSLNCSGDLRRRFLDLGIIKGTLITPVLISPLNDPIAYSVRGSLLAIRREDAQFIIVKNESKNF